MSMAFQNDQHRMLALFDRALARDFIDVYVLATHFSPDSMIAMAQMIDPGFDSVALSEMLATIERFEDLNLSGPGIDTRELREFFTNWHSSILRSNQNPQR